MQPPAKAAQAMAARPTARRPGWSLSRPQNIAEFDAMLTAVAEQAPPDARFIVHPDDWYTPDRPGYWERELAKAIWQRSLRHRIRAFLESF